MLRFESGAAEDGAPIGHRRVLLQYCTSSFMREQQIDLVFAPDEHVFTVTAHFNNWNRILWRAQRTPWLQSDPEAGTASRPIALPWSWWMHMRPPLEALVSCGELRLLRACLFGFGR